MGSITRLRCNSDVGTSVLKTEGTGIAPYLILGEG